MEETLADRADQLKGYTVATAIFGRGEDAEAIEVGWSATAATVAAPGPGL